VALRLLLAESLALVVTVMELVLLALAPLEWEAVMEAVSEEVLETVPVSLGVSEVLGLMVTLSVAEGEEEAEVLGE